MTSREKTLSAFAAALLAAAVFSAAAAPVVCLVSAVSALALSFYLRHRGAFREDNTPLLGALLIGGSAMTSVGGLVLVSPNAIFFVMAVAAIPILFLLVFGLRERIRAFLRDMDVDTRDDDKP